MNRCVFKSAFLITTVFACGLWQSKEARAADVSLISGLVGVNCPGQITGNVGGSAQLEGNDFSLRFAFSAPPTPVCAPAPVTVNVFTPFGPSDAFGSVIYQGVGTASLRASLLFDAATVSGFVEGLDPNDFNQVLFSVNFNGSGTGFIASTRSTFEVGAVPEPATLILLGTGAAFFGGASRWRKARKRRASGAELQG